jgi:hypothetical protein
MLLVKLLNEWKWPVIVIGVAFLLEFVPRAWRAHMQHRSLSWPVSHGRITKVMVHQAKHESILTVSYTYPLPTDPGSAFGEFQKEFDSVEEAEKWADALAYRAVPVRFDPTNFWTSELPESDLKTVVDATTLDS